jgi:TRAP-type mannitol/chloroaromatic compound transport system permease small subunit
VSGHPRGDPSSSPAGHPPARALRIASALDAITRYVGRSIAWLIVPMVLSLVWEVVARYFFNAPTEWAYDMTFMLYGTFFMVGSAWTLQRAGHIRTDIYYSRWTKRTRARVDLACYLALFFPAMAVFTWLTWAYFWRSFELNERIVTSPWLPIVWPFKFMMPAAGVLLLLQGIAETIRCAIRAFGPRDDADDASPSESSVVP